VGLWDGFADDQHLDAFSYRGPDELKCKSLFRRVRGSRNLETLSSPEPTVHEVIDGRHPTSVDGRVGQQRRRWLADQENGADSIHGRRLSGGCWDEMGLQRCEKLRGFHIRDFGFLRWSTDKTVFFSFFSSDSARKFHQPRIKASTVPDFFVSCHL